MTMSPQPHDRPTAVERRTAQRLTVRRSAATGAAFAALCSVCSPAQALDGCKVLLCLAAPSWRSIPECVPPIRELFHDLARGKAFPTCGMAGAGNSATQRWAAAPAYCPPQYTRWLFGDDDGPALCAYSGAVEIKVNGTLWSRTWWSLDGRTVTDFTPSAKSQLGAWDTTFDTDYARWLRGHPPASGCSAC